MNIPIVFEYVGFGRLVGNRLILLCFLIVLFGLGSAFIGVVGLFLRKTLALECYWFAVIKSYDYLLLNRSTWINICLFFNCLCSACLSGPVFAT